MSSSEKGSVDAGDEVAMKREAYAYADGMVILEIGDWIRQDSERRRLAGENAPADGVERVAAFIDFRLKDNHLANNAVEKCSKKKNRDQGEDVPPTKVEAYEAQMLLLEIRAFIEREGGQWRKEGNHATAVAVERVADVIERLKKSQLAGLQECGNASGPINPLRKRPKWSDERLRKLWEMHNEPGMTMTRLAESFGVSRQAIYRPLRRAEEKFSNKAKGRPFGGL